MSRTTSDERLPIELKLRLLQAEIERLDSDASWIELRRREIRDEIGYYEKLLMQSEEPKPVLKRVK